MDNHTAKYGRSGNSNSFKQRRSGYEPSDTETEWQQESPWRDLKNDMRPRDVPFMADRPKTPVRVVSPLNRSKRYSSNHDYTLPIPLSETSTPATRRASRSPYKPRRDSQDNVTPKIDSLDTRKNVSPLSKPEKSRDNVSPFAKSERRRHASAYKSRVQEPRDDQEYVGGSTKQSPRVSTKQSPRVPHKYVDAAEVRQSQEPSRGSERSNYSRRTKSTPKPRPREDDQQITIGVAERAGHRSPSPLSRSVVKKQREPLKVKAPTASEINEMVANAKLTNGTNAAQNVNMESSSPGNIFFSREYAAFATQKSVPPKKTSVTPPPRPETILERETKSHQRSRSSATPTPHVRVVTPNTFSSRTPTSTSSALSRHNSYKSSTEGSKFSDGSVRSSESLRKFTANRQKVYKETWFGCVSKGPCMTRKSPEKRDIDEASFIGKAFVVENLRKFWTEKHQPGSLNGFSCHKHQAQLLKQLILPGICPHVLFKGPTGSGKKALTMALLRHIFGDPAWEISHELRPFQQENRPTQVVIPITSSPHHVELNLRAESKNARYALMGLVKDITSNAVVPEVSTASFKADYKVLVLYEVDKASENVQHLIKWIMDCYTDSCKIILCCEDDTDVLDSLKTRCEVIKVDAPVTHEIMEVLIQISRKENFDLPMSFAAKIATKSKQNLRKAIMALEACKAHNYPFVDDQPIPLGWEEVLVDLAAEILSDPSPKRLFYTRGKFQKLLVDFVHPKLILQKLVEQFLKGVDANLKRELYYWHSYYDKRLPVGTSALLKLEEFVAKFMSIYRKSFRDRTNP